MGGMGASYPPKSISTATASTGRAGSNSTTVMPSAAAARRMRSRTILEVRDRGLIVERDPVVEAVVQGAARGHLDVRLGGPDVLGVRREGAGLVPECEDQPVRVQHAVDD